MITRTTTVGTLKNYRYSLNRANNYMASTMNTVTSQRLFNSYAENPAIATRCFQLRRSYMRTTSQLTVNDSLRHKYDVAWQSMESVSQDVYSISADTAWGSILTAENDPDASGRNALGQSMVAKAKNIVQTMNGRYGENYVFAGADMLNVPFTWGPRMNSEYQGEADPTNSAAFEYMLDPNDPDYAGDPSYTNDSSKAALEPVIRWQYNENLQPGDEGYEMPYTDRETGKPTDNIAQAVMQKKKNPDYNPKEAIKYTKYLKENGRGTNNEAEAASALYYRGVPVDSNLDGDREKMEYFAGETKQLDIGLGHKEEKEGKAVSSSVFDSALQGFYYLGGYGSEVREVTIKSGSRENGDYKEETVSFNIPNNVVSIINRMGEILQRCNSDNGAFASEEDEAECRLLAQKFEDTTSTIIQRRAELDTQSGFLRDNSTLLSDTAVSLSQQFMELEDAEPAAAISEYMFARYCYDAALKVGNSVLSQSLMDYMSL